MNENFEIIEDESGYPEKPKRKGKPPRLSAESRLILLMIAIVCLSFVWFKLSEAFHAEPFPPLWITWGHLICTGLLTGILVQTTLVLFGGSDG